MNAQQKEAFEKIVSAQEAERKRIAEDLHDDLGATLSTLSLYVSHQKENLQNTAQMQPLYDKLMALTTKAVKDIRSISHNLLPKDFTDNGLYQILNQLSNCPCTSYHVNIK